MESYKTSKDTRSYVSDLDDLKSIGGYVYILHHGTISWRSKKQDTVAQSTAEAEYIALSDATCKAIHLRQRIAEIEQIGMQGPTTINCDSQGVISIGSVMTVGFTI